MINKVRLIDLPKVDNETGYISVFSNSNLPFQIVRVFTVHVNKECSRGHHAHKLCNQLLVCLYGKNIVVIDDSINKKEIQLTKPNEGLYIPAGIWAEQKYAENSILMVLTDQLYNETDYIRNYSDFLKFRNNL